MFRKYEVPKECTRHKRKKHSHVIRGAYSLRKISDRRAYVMLSRKAKVDDFQITIIIEKKVVWLKVSMQYIPLVKIQEPTLKLFQVSNDFFVCECLVVIQPALHRLRA